MALREEDTRLIPYASWEYAWAHQRPAQHRTPLPAVGDEVFYRHDYWGSVDRVDILDVQSLDDIDDPHLWRVETDGFGQPFLLEGRPVLMARLDPWPTLILRTRWGNAQTREARLRGSPGWLPLDWQVRYRPMPEFVVMGG